MLLLFLSSAFLLNIAGTSIAFAETEPNQMNNLSVTAGETTRGWDGPSDTLTGIYIDGADPKLAALASALVSVGVASPAIGVLTGYVLAYVPSGRTTVHGRLDRYYEEVFIAGEFAYFRTTYTLYLYYDENNKPLPGNPYTAVYEGSQLWSIDPSVSTN